MTEQFRNFHTMPSKPIWTHHLSPNIDPFEFIWTHLDTVWTPFGPCSPIWILSDRFGPLWTHVDPFGPIYIDHLRSIRTYLETLWTHLDTYIWTISDQLFKKSIMSARSYVKSILRFENFSGSEFWFLEKLNNF